MLLSEEIKGISCSWGNNGYRISFARFFVGEYDEFMAGFNGFFYLNSIL